MNNQTRTQLSNAALEACRVLISNDDYEDIHAYINEHNEWGLGIETLVYTLCEEDKEVSSLQYHNIMEALESMDLGTSKYAEFMNQRVRNT